MGIDPSGELPTVRYVMSALKQSLGNPKAPRGSNLLTCRTRAYDLDIDS
jgi:hypothetical protein